MSEDHFEECRAPSWLRSVYWDIYDKKADREKVELAMEYFCHLRRSEEQIPHDMLDLIDFIFTNYLERRHFNGALEAAFGFSGTQGDRRLEERNERLAIDIARNHLNGRSLKNAKLKVGEEANLCQSSIEEIWRKHKQTGIIACRIGLQMKGKDFSRTQIVKAEKALAKQHKEIEALLGNSKD